MMPSVRRILCAEEAIVQHLATQLVIVVVKHTTVFVLDFFLQTMFPRYTGQWMIHLIRLSPK